MLWRTAVLEECWMAERRDAGDEAERRVMRAGGDGEQRRGRAMSEMAEAGEARQALSGGL